VLAWLLLRGDGLTKEDNQVGELVAQVQRTPGPRQIEFSPTGQTKFVICDYTIEGAFQELTEHLSSEINTLGYPRAALFGFCVGLVAYNVLSVVQAALRSVHGAKKIEEEVSGYYIADEIAGTYRGMMIAIAPEHWMIFRSITVVGLVALLQDLASKVRLSAFKKHRRGPKKKPPRRRSSKQEPHVSTARLIAQRRARNQTP
jgi:hypothetical protein